MNIRTPRRIALLASLLTALVTLGCSDGPEDEQGLDMRSRGSGERNERLGNDPAEQNTGEGSTTESDLANPPPDAPN